MSEPQHVAPKEQQPPVMPPRPKSPAIGADPDAIEPVTAGPSSAAPRVRFSSPAPPGSASSNGVTLDSGAAPPPLIASATSVTTQPSIPGAASAPVSEELLSFNQQLNAAERYWKFKSAFQAVLIITGLIGIGTVAWAVSTNRSYGYSYYGYDSFWSLWPCLVTFSASIAWCFICLVTLLVRRQPVIPGLRVALELILWLSFILTAMFATINVLGLISWGEYGDLGYGYNSAGDYQLAANGTWVWRSNSGSTYTYSRNCNGTSYQSSYYYTGHYFSTCAEQDAYVNTLWQEKPERVNVELTGTVCQYFGLVLHLVLFIWACVDTHLYRRRKVSKDAEKLAANIVQSMIHNGAVVPPPGQAHVRPNPTALGYWQIPGQNVYAVPYGTQPVMQQMPIPMQQMPQTPISYYASPPVAGSVEPRGGGPPGPSSASPSGAAVGSSVAGPSNEKTGLRYA